MAREILIVSDDDVASRQAAAAPGARDSVPAGPSPAAALGRLLAGATAPASIDAEAGRRPGAEVESESRRRGAHLAVGLAGAFGRQGATRR